MRHNFHSSDQHRTLNLSGNGLEAIADGLGDIGESLQLLDLSNNKLKKVRVCVPECERGIDLAALYLVSANASFTVDSLSAFGGFPTHCPTSFHPPSPLRAPLSCRKK